MSMSTNNIFNRTVKTNIIIYPANGMGRDGYITYNNAGFWKKNIKPVVPKEQFKRPPFAVFRSLKNTPPTWTYYSDGTGRDSYVYYNSGGLIRKYSPLARQNLQKFLRGRMGDNKWSNQKIYLSKDERLYLNKINHIQKDLVNRLYNNYKNKFINNSTLNNNRYGRKFLFNNTKNGLYRSSSQIIGRQTLEPVKNNNLDNSCNTLDKNDAANFNSFNNNDLGNGNKLNSNSQVNIHDSNFSNKFNLKKIDFNGNTLLSPQNNNIIRNLRGRNKKVNPWYHKRKYVYNSLDNKYEIHPKVKCSFDEI